MATGLNEQSWGRSSKSLVLITLAIAMILSTMLLSYMPGGNLVNIGVGAAIAVTTIVYLIVGRRELWVSPELVMLMIWLAYSLIPSLFAPDQEQAMFKVMTMIQVIVLSLVILQICIWQGSTRILIWTYIVAVCLSYLVTFTSLNDLVINVQTNVTADASIMRTGSTLGNANTFGVAAVLAQAMVVVVLSIKSSTSIERVIAIICYFFLIGAILNSGSRTALTGMILVLLGMSWVFSLWRLNKLGGFVKWILIVSAIVAALFFVLKDVEQVRDRYEAVILDSGIDTRIEDFINLFLTSGEDEAVERSGQSIADRMGLAKMAWNLANEYPFGVGLDNFAVFSGVYAHSNYLELLATTGFIGMFLYYVIYAFLMTKTLKLWARLKDNGLPKALALGVIVLALMDVANVSYYTKPVWIFLIIIIATTELLRRQAFLNSQYKNQRVNEYYG